MCVCICINRVLHSMICQNRVPLSWPIPHADIRATFSILFFYKQKNSIFLFLFVSGFLLLRKERERNNNRQMVIIFNYKKTILYNFYLFVYLFCDASKIYIRTQIIYATRARWGKIESRACKSTFSLIDAHAGQRARVINQLELSATWRLIIIII